jgi:tetratricopeptide (TPR) repeat protein
VDRVHRARECAREGWTAFESNSLPRAKELLSEAVSLDPQQPDYHAALATVYVRLHEPGKATAEFEKAVRKDPANIEFRLDLAQAYQTNDQDLKALQVLDAAEPGAPLQERWIFTRSFSLFRVGRFNEAQRQYEKLLANPALVAPANFFLGNICFAQDRFQEAVPYYAAAIRLGDRPTNRAFNAYTYNYGLALYRLSRFAEAAAAFQRSIDRFRNDPLPWMWLGRCKQELGSFQEAIADFEESIRISPNFRPSYFELARLQFQYGDKRRAAELFLKVNQMKRAQLDEDERAARRGKFPATLGVTRAQERP